MRATREPGRHVRGGRAIVQSAQTPPDSGHIRAVEELRAAVSAVPRETPLRLAKRTSNLFRARRRSPAPGLDVRGLTRVLRVDPEARTADVQGMTTYESLVDATLTQGLMPCVVPQLKSITLGGAVSGLGIESSSFRNGLPHESVLELEVLTGDGRLLVARPDNEHKSLYDGFPNSYGTLGYALRLVIELEPVRPYVKLRHVGFRDANAFMVALARICAERAHDGVPVEFVEGTMFSPDEFYLTLGTFVETAPWTSDYTRRGIYYRSIGRHPTDYLTVRDYLWRWDTDWFWCSRAFGLQHAPIRALWPARYRRSDVYHRLFALDQRLGVTAGLERLRGRAPREIVIQDVEIPVDRAAEFLDFLHREIAIAPVWLCPLRLRATRRWPLYPLDPDTLYVNIGFWGATALEPGERDGDNNRRIERVLQALDGHKSLYSTAFYDEEEFWRLYNGPAYRSLKDAYDPEGRLLDIYEKCVQRR